ncbi:alpha-glucan family phosphorylase [bacterium]|nr:alpha-glucan family phosphorylase [bacterium]
MDQIRSTVLTDLNIPKPFERLQELAYNVWWSWSPTARRLFSHIHPELWNHYRNPVELLINVDAHHWNPLLQSDDFLSQYQKVLREYDRHMSPDRPGWFGEQFPDYNGGPVAYFCSEYGLSEALPIYAGGLGILAGDTCKSMDYMGVPFVAVGLMYRSGYFEQHVDMDGSQSHIYRPHDFSRMPASLVQTRAGRELLIKVPLGGREIYARTWKIQVGRVPVLLLDTDVLLNDPADRPITSQLYVSGREMRLCQEIVLGIGGALLLRELDIEPAIWHMNEGHSVFLAVERIRRKMEADDVSFEEARRDVQGSTVFTTHTPVMAGHEAFETDLIEKYFKTEESRMGHKIEDFCRLSFAYPDQPGAQPFSLTALAIRVSAVVNGVSKLHGEVTQKSWGHLRAATALDESRSDVDYVTNGVHVLSWLGTDIRELYERYIGQDWPNFWKNPEEWKRVIKVLPDMEVWDAHEAQKSRFAAFLKQRLLHMYSRHGDSPDKLRKWQSMIEPKSLWIGFARRFAGYKRALLIFNEFEKLRAICTNPERPVRIVFAGKAHPNDREGQDLIRKIFDIVENSALHGHIFFLENYDMHVARRLVQGVDVWLNNPVRPMEASGTSGIKAAMNGVLNLSIPDGWWCEGYNGENGWQIGDGTVHENPGHQAWVDAGALYGLLEKDVVPLFYDRNKQGIPQGWIRKMKSALTTITHDFSTARMSREYVEKIYMKTRPWQSLGAESAVKTA